MKTRLGLALCVCSAAAVIGGVVAAGAAHAAKPQEPQWAYALAPAPSTPAPPVVDDGTKFHLDGSNAAFTVTQIRGRDPNKVPLGPGDWYPEDHPAMPKIVAQGDDPMGGRACSLCHYPNGKGRSENAPVSGLPKDYFIEQIHDMASGLRKSSEPAKANAFVMDDIAKHMSEDEIVAAATYFGAIPWTPWIKVVESTTAPKVRSAAGLYITLTGPDAGTEPLDGRIIETPINGVHTETLRDPRSSFIAYVPVGSIARGKALVETGGGGKTIQCTACHGADLNGVANIPPLAARSPSYLARQLNDFEQGTRNGTMAALMKPVVAKLTPADITDIVAYLASRPAPAQATHAAASTPGAVAPG